MSANGINVAALVACEQEQRTLVGGIWSMYANSTSQVGCATSAWEDSSVLPRVGVRPRGIHVDCQTQLG